MSRPISKMFGGKLIGQGEFGCAMTPPLKCKGKSRPISLSQMIGLSGPSVGKITTPKDAALEIRISKELSIVCC